MIRFLVGEVLLGARVGQGPGSLQPSLGTDCGKKNHQTYPGSSQIQLKERLGKAPLPKARGDTALPGAGWGTCPAPPALEAQRRPRPLLCSGPTPITAASPTRTPAVGRLGVHPSSLSGPLLLTSAEGATALTTGQIPTSTPSRKRHLPSSPFLWPVARGRGSRTFSGGAGRTCFL